MGAISTRPPKGTSLGEKSSYNVKIGPTVRPVDEMQKQKRHGEKTDSGKLAICPDHPRCRSAIWICVCGHIQEIVTYYSVQGFRSHGVSKFALSRWLGHWLIQQLYYRMQAVITRTQNRYVDITTIQCYLNQGGFVCANIFQHILYRSCSLIQHRP